MKLGLASLLILLENFYLLILWPKCVKSVGRLLMYLLNYACFIFFQMYFDLSITFSVIQLIPNFIKKIMQNIWAWIDTLK